MESSGGEGIGILFILLIGLMGVGSILLWLWSLFHCVTNRYLSDTNRLIGILLIIFLQLLGSLIYLFLPRESEPQR